MASSKTIAGVLLQDQNADRFTGLVDPASGTVYALRAVNLVQAGTGDTADPTAVLYGPDGNALFAAAATAADGGALPKAPSVVAQLQGYDGTNTQLLRLDSHKSLQGTLFGPDGNALLPSAAAMADGESNATTMSRIGARPEWFNGSTWDRQYNNIEVTLLASAARTATTSAPTQVNYNAKGVVLWLNVTAASGTGGLQVGVFAVDPVSNNGVLLSAALPTAITSTGCSGYVVYPGAAETAGSASVHVDKFVQSPLPRHWFAQVTHGDASSYTYSLGMSYVL